MTVKSGMGDSTKHSLNTKDGKGPGAHNTPLKKSTVNPTQPLVDEAKPRGKGMPPQPPQAAAKTGASKAGVILTEARPGKTSSTFTAPRKSGGGSPTDTGYTKL